MIDNIGTLLTATYSHIRISERKTNKQAQSLGGRDFRVKTGRRWYCDRAGLYQCDLRDTCVHMRCDIGIAIFLIVDCASSRRLASQQPSHGDFRVKG